MTDRAQGVCNRGARVITTPLMYWQTVGRNGNLFWQIGAGESSPGIMKRGVGGWGVPRGEGGSQSLSACGYFACHMSSTAVASAGLLATDDIADRMLHL